MSSSINVRSLAIPVLSLPLLLEEKNHEAHDTLDERSAQRAIIHGDPGTHLDGLDLKDA